MCAAGCACAFWVSIARRRRSAPNRPWPASEWGWWDPTQDLHDRYGRTLAYLDKADGWDYSVEAARAGAAHAYIYHDQPAARYPAIAAAQKEAIDAQRGLWGPPCYGNAESHPV